MRILSFLVLLLSLGSAAPAQEPNKWREDALALPGLVNEQYAYLDRLPGGAYKLSPKLQAEAEAVTDSKSLLAFAERALFLLADHHAITGGSFKDSWALVPSYADIWVERQAGQYKVTAVRGLSIAEQAGIEKGATILQVGGTPIADAVEAFWADLGVTDIDNDWADYAARTLLAGRRDRPREIELRNPDGKTLSLTLSSRYDLHRDEQPVRLINEGNVARIVFNDSLGNSDSIAAFDEAMAHVGPKQKLVIDLRDTASGGTTSVARAVMGWFVTKPTNYQIHRSPAEERFTGIPRQWIEQVLPRVGKYRKGPVTVLVGRWTGSMGEGLAVGLKAVGAKVEGEPMAHLLGAIEDIRLPNTGFVFKIPTERLYTVDGLPREDFVPARYSGK